MRPWNPNTKSTSRPGELNPGSSDRPSRSVRTVSQPTEAGAGVCIAARFITLTGWSHAFSKCGNISTRCSSMKWSGIGIHVFELAFEYTDTDSNYVWYLCRRTLWQSYVGAVAYSGHLFWGDLTKPAITTVNVDRLYLNLVICLQLDIALLVQNTVKIWNCLP